jgi:ketosteroid isomerase-like protein
MSEHDVDLVREWVSLWAGEDMVAAAADAERMAPIIEGVHPDIEVRWAEPLADNETYRGVDEAQRALAEWLEPWAEYRQEPLEFIDAGDRVVVTYRQWGRGKESGAEVEMEVTQVYGLRDGKIAGLREYKTKAEALEAVRTRT